MGCDGTRFSDHSTTALHDYPLHYCWITSLLYLSLPVTTSLLHYMM